ncbi:hypothetical protein B0H16DRAFT_1638984 [Mycena metata]|uniref:Uncharacterized protein n=1 Tax=Mycena metata TaxID=1033252 RepID=A0AAD7E1E6_9AGAR|nr:hypothetical protein B0H16DRAFT_1638984 [Mycena metata]
MILPWGMWKERGWAMRLCVLDVLRVDVVFAAPWAFNLHQPESAGAATSPHPIVIHGRMDGWMVFSQRVTRCRAARRVGDCDAAPASGGDVFSFSGGENDLSVYRLFIVFFLAQQRNSLASSPLSPPSSSLSSLSLCIAPNMLTSFRKILPPQ